MSQTRDYERMEQFDVQQLRGHGLGATPVRHYRRLEERPLTRSGRRQITILFGGLTRRHELLIESGVQSLGYEVKALPTPTRMDCQAGKEYCNTGQCNPTYFTVGSVIHFLKRLRDKEGLTPEQIVERYAYMTAGSCGPCRFGMYESEYRLALHNAGFPGFRVLVFQQGGGLKQAASRSGIDFDVQFFLALLNGLFIGDILNILGQQIRPYELVPGRTEAVLEECVALCQRRLREKDYAARPTWKARVLSLVTAGYDARDVAMFLDQLEGGWYTDALQRCAELLDEKVEVDFTRPKPRVKIVGEFWAQTTEGDGNFRMFDFLEHENAEVMTEPVATWVDYLLHQAMLGRTVRRGLPEDMRLEGRETFAERLARLRRYGRRLILMRLARWAIHREYDRLREAAGGVLPPLVDQAELRELARRYFNPLAAGGEGHLEVAKTIYYSKKKQCHMVLSLKPFGCMPSTQSDGAQAAVVAHYPEVVFLPIETGPEGEANAYSRVQMALGEAKLRCKAEFQEALARAGVSLREVRAYVKAHPDLRRPLQRLPAYEGFPGRAAGFVLHVAERIARDRAWHPSDERARADKLPVAPEAVAAEARADKLPVAPDDGRARADNPSTSSGRGLPVAPDDGRAWADNPSTSSGRGLPVAPEVGAASAAGTADESAGREALRPAMSVTGEQRG